MDHQGWVPISSIADFNMVLIYLFCLLHLTLFTKMNGLCLVHYDTKGFHFFWNSVIQIKRLNVEISFILDALLASDTIEVQVRNFTSWYSQSKFTPWSLYIKFFCVLFVTNFHFVAYEFSLYTLWFQSCRVTRSGDAMSGLSGLEIL